jgi:hypothetical protein
MQVNIMLMQLVMNMIDKFMDCPERADTASLSCQGSRENDAERVE